MSDTGKHPGKDLKAELERLKKERNAVILAHNYQPPGIQDAADFIGDSLGLSQQAARTKADVIVFCGVDFMAETAKILSPEKTVIIPEREAGCPLASMITADGLRKLKSENPGVPVMSYVNTPASVKAESDVCCTSSNLIKVSDSFGSDALIFTPDRHLAAYLQSRTDKRIIAWKGFCPTHVRILPQHILMQKKLHPDAKVMVHPECRLDVIRLADHVTSTEGMVRFAGSSDAREFIVATETGILHRLGKEVPGKKFYPATTLAVCPNMKKISIHKIVAALENMDHTVTMPDEVQKGARNAITRMLEIS